MIDFYGKTPVFGIGGNLQTVNVNVAYRRVSSRQGDGDAAPCAEGLINPKTTRTEIYLVQDLSREDFAVPSIGAIVGGWHIDSIAVAYSAEWPRVEVSGHVHNGLPHVSVARIYAPSIALPVGYGRFPDCAGDAASSAVYRLTANHKDLFDDECVPRFATDYDGKETLEVKALTDEVCAPSDDWLDLSLKTAEDISKAVARTFLFEHHIRGVAA